MSNGFVHSVSVPRFYKIAAKIVQKVREEGASFKTLVFECTHPNVSGIYALTYTTLQKGDLVDHIIRSTGILIKEPRLNPWLARVFITELIWGKQRLASECKPVKTVLAYENEIRAAFNKIPSNTKSIKNENKVKSPRYVRINTLLVDVVDAISKFEGDGWHLLPKATDYPSYLKSLTNLSGSYFLQDIHIPELFAFPAGTNFFNHVGYNKGQFILQDKASCLPAFLLNPKPGSVVLDMCAAPGMKTSHLAAIIRNSGKVYAAEIDAKRYQTLHKQLEITNSSCASALNVDAMTLDEKQCPDVEYILVDPSCSGSGMVNRPKLSDMDGTSDDDRLKRLQSFQVMLLRHALLNFKSVKRVVYSTCSIHSKENEEVIDEVLRDVQDAYKLIPAKDLLQGRWINYSSKQFSCEDKCLYAKPEEDLCNGFFVAVFERNSSIPLPICKRKPKLRKNTLHLSENGEIDQQNAYEEVTELENGNHKKRKRRGKRKRQSEVLNETSEMEKESGKNVEPEGAIEEGANCLLSTNSGCKENVEESADVSPTKKKKKKKDKEKEVSEEQIQDADDHSNVQNTDESLTECLSPTKKKKKKKDKEKEVPEEQIQDADNQGNVQNIDESLTECVSPTKKKKKKKDKEKEVSVEQIQDVDNHSNVQNIDESLTECLSPTKKKKKKKDKEKEVPEEQIQDADNHSNDFEVTKERKKSKKKLSKIEV